MRTKMLVLAILAQFYEKVYIVTILFAPNTIRRPDALVIFVGKIEKWTSCDNKYFFLKLF